MNEYNQNPEYYARDLLNVLEISIPPIDPFKVAIILGFDFRFENLRSCEAILISPHSYAYDFYTKGIDIQDSTDVYPIAWIESCEKYVKIREENVFLKRFNSTLTIITLPDDTYDVLDDDMFY